MSKTVKFLFILLIISTFTNQANSESSWIKKKDDKNKETVSELKTNSNKWIKKKEVKENKKKLKEKRKSFG